MDSELTVILSNTTFFELDWHIQNIIIGANQKDYNQFRKKQFFELDTIINTEHRSNDKFCEIIHRSLHNFRQEYWQALALFIALANSLLNPIIYAFWYPEFRQQLKRLLLYLRYHCISLADIACFR